MSTDGDDSPRPIDAEIRALARLLAEGGLTAEDIIYLHRKRDEEDHARWAWQQIKKHAPWVSIVAAGIASAIGYLASHSINVSGKP